LSSLHIEYLRPATPWQRERQNHAISTPVSAAE
jgi:hypothetical protein